MIFLFKYIYSLNIFIVQKAQIVWVFPVPGPLITENSFNHLHNLIWNSLFFIFYFVVETEVNEL